MIVHTPGSSPASMLEEHNLPSPMPRCTSSVRTSTSAPGENWGHATMDKSSASSEFRDDVASQRQDARPPVGRAFFCGWTSNSPRYSDLRKNLNAGAAHADDAIGKNAVRGRGISILRMPRSCRSAGRRVNFRQPQEWDRNWRFTTLPFSSCVSTGSRLTSATQGRECFDHESAHRRGCETQAERARKSTFRAGSL